MKKPETILMAKSRIGSRTLMPWGWSFYQRAEVVARMREIGWWDRKDYSIVRVRLTELATKRRKRNA